MEDHPGSLWLRGCVLKSQWNPRERHFLVSVFCDDVAQNSLFVSRGRYPFRYDLVASCWLLLSIHFLFLPGEIVYLRALEDRGFSIGYDR